MRSGRFDYIVRFPAPSVSDRAAIVRLCCRQVPLAPDVDPGELAARMDGLTGADIESVCKKATLLAIADFQHGARGSAFIVSRGDFETVMGDARSLSAGTGA